jgi:hypothetical protein
MTFSNCFLWLLKNNLPTVSFDKSQIYLLTLPPGYSKHISSRFPLVNRKYIPSLFPIIAHKCIKHTVPSGYTQMYHPHCLLGFLTQLWPHCPYRVTHTCMTSLSSTVRSLTNASPSLSHRVTFKWIILYSSLSASSGYSQLNRINASCG